MYIKHLLTFIFISNGIAASQAPLSFLEYINSSQTSIEHFDKQFEERFAQPIEEKYHILREQKHRDMLISVSEEINARYNGNVMVSVGQSPAYIIKAAQILSQLQNNTLTQYKYLAFSGKLLQEGRVADNTKEFIVSHEKIPTESQLASYKKYLSSLQLDPKTIVDRFIQTQQRTIFLDFINSGKGFASFVYILNTIARKQGIEAHALQKSVDYHGFQMSGYTLKFRLIRIKGAASSPHHICFCDLSKNNLQVVDKKLLFSLAQDKMNQLFNDRLIFSFAKEKWDKDDPQQFKISSNAKLLIFKIIHHIHRREQVEPAKKKQKL